MNGRQWVVDVYADADALTLNGWCKFPVSGFQLLETRNSKLETDLMLFRYRA